MTTTAANYGDLYDYLTGDVIRPATRREAMESLSERNANGAIEVDGQTVWVHGVEQAQVCGKDIQMDLSGVQHCWLSMVAGDLTPSIRTELEEAIMEEDDDTGRMVASESGKTRIGGVWYRWGH